jgi:CubicO group peptidase (beta-lactamase class C family)
VKVKDSRSPKSWPALVALVLATLPTPAAADCPTAVTWPVPDWPVAPAEGPAALALDDYAFTLVGADAERKGLRTNTVLVVHAGHIIYERYARGWQVEHPHLTWSVTKSMLAAMVGVAVGEGWLHPGDSVCDHYDAVDECAMTPDHLLSMGSGLDWNEGYEDEPYHQSSVIAMLYGLGALDMAAFVGHHPSAAPPGRLYRYSSGDSVLLAAVLAGALPARMRDTFPHDFLFGPLGMHSAVLEQDRAGTFVGSSYAYATPRDMARFGYLYLRDGCWHDERLLPEGWVAQSVAVNPVFLEAASYEWSRDGDAVPGRHFWTNHAIPERGIDSVWPDVPDDAYQASGHWGQSITVIPSEDLVVVRTADDREPGVLDKNRLLSLAIAVAREAAP